MRFNKISAAVLATLFSATASSFAADAAPVLHIGDVMPPLAPTKWVKKDPVTIEQGKVYVVEFWATWCVPCKKAIPHITELAHKYEGKVTFVGMDVWEHPDPETDEVILSKVEPFVASMGDKMDYHVAVDGIAAKMATTWLDPTSQQYIPASYIIDAQGRLAWIGLPSDLEGVLTQVLAGTWDASAERQKVDAENAKGAPARAAYAAVSKLMKAKDYPGVVKAVDDAVAATPSLGTDSNLVAVKLHALYESNPAGALADVKSMLAASNTLQQASNVMRPIAAVKPTSPMTAADWKTIAGEIDPLIAPGTSSSGDLYADYADLLNRAGEKDMAIFYQRKSVNLTIADTAKRKNDDHAEYFINLLKKRQANLDTMLAAAGQPAETHQ